MDAFDAAIVVVPINVEDAIESMPPNEYTDDVDMNTGLMRPSICVMTIVDVANTEGLEVASDAGSTSRAAVLPVAVEDAASLPVAISIIPFVVSFALDAPAMDTPSIYAFAQISLFADATVQSVVSSGESENVHVPVIDSVFCSCANSL